jgi:hypothetical protein
MQAITTIGLDIAKSVFQVHTVPTTRKILATLHSVLEYAISQD